MTTDRSPDVGAGPPPDVVAVSLVAGPGAVADRLALRDRLETMAPGYLDRVRAGTRRLAHRDGPVVDVTLALADVEDTAVVDLEVPTLSSLRVGRLVKVAIKRLTTWYLRYLAQQISAFGLAVTRLGTLLVARTDRIEETTKDLTRDVERLRARVERLEGTTGGDAGSDGARA